MMTPRGSISFDGAAAYYDKTRALGPATAIRITELLEKELQGRGAVLEVGVGTGRIALPLAGAGIPLVGLDLARNMLNKLVENAGGSAPFPLLQGDGTRLPFRDGTFAGGIASWVLHLVTEWREVLAEFVRVIAPGGLLLIDVGGEDDSVLTRLTWKFRDLAGNSEWPRGAKSHAEADAAMTALGATPRPLEPVVEETEATLESHIRLLERGIYSVAWGLDESVRVAAARELRRWAVTEHGSLTDPKLVATSHVWRAYDLND